MIENRKCCKCNKIKPISDFLKDKRKKSGYTNTCKPCGQLYRNSRSKETKQRRKEASKRYHKNHPERCKENRRKSWLKSKYNITPQIYDDMLKNQNNKCKICNKEKNEILSVDHNHINGNIRGLLCKRCNIGLGQFEDNIEYLIKAIEYIKKEGNI